jgi:hypothetical protein
MAVLGTSIVLMSVLGGSLAYRYADSIDVHGLTYDQLQGSATHLSEKISQRDFGSLHSLSDELSSFTDRLYSQMKIDRVTPDIQFWMFAHLNSPRLVKYMISGGSK